MSDYDKQQARTIRLRVIQPLQAMMNDYGKIVRESHPVTCTDKCAACCYQLVAMPYAEVLALASYLVETWPAARIESLRQRLRADLIALERPGADKKVYFRMQRPCAFLEVDQEGAAFRGTCSIYSERPMACRLLYAVTDPARCSPTDEDQTVGSPDFSKVLGATLRAIQVALGDPGIIMVPMQAGLSIALDSLCDGMNEGHTAKIYWWFDRLVSWGAGENVIEKEI